MMKLTLIIWLLDGLKRMWHAILETTDHTGAADVAGAQEFWFMYLCDQKALNLFAHIVLCVYV